jgi:hypothetical protein
MLTRILLSVKASSSVLDNQEQIDELLRWYHSNLTIGNDVDISWQDFEKHCRSCKVQGFLPVIASVDAWVQLLKTEEDQQEVHRRLALACRDYFFG